MTTTLSVKEYAEKHGISIETVRRRIRQGKIQADFDGHQYYIHDDEQQSATSSQQHLHDRISDLQSQLEKAYVQIDDYPDQISELHQLLAISQKNIDSLTDQKQLLLEDMRHRSLWSKVKATFGFASS